MSLFATALFVFYFCLQVACAPSGFPPYDGRASITNAPSGYAAGAPNSCCFLVQDTLSGAYWPHNSTTTVVVLVTSTILVTSATKYIDTVITNIETSITTLNTTTVSSFDNGLDQLTGNNLFPGFSTTITTLSNAVVTTFGDVIPSPTGFYIYPSVKIIHVPALTDSSGNINCVTTTRWQPDGCPEFTSMVNPYLDEYYKGNQLVTQSEDVSSNNVKATSTTASFTTWRNASMSRHATFTPTTLLLSTPFLFIPWWATRVQINPFPFQTVDHGGSIQATGTVKAAKHTGITQVLGSMQADDPAGPIQATGSHQPRKREAPEATVLEQHGVYNSMEPIREGSIPQQVINFLGADSGYRARFPYIGSCLTAGPPASYSCLVRGPIAAVAATEMLGSSAVSVTSAKCFRPEACEAAGTAVENPKSPSDAGTTPETSRPISDTVANGAAQPKSIPRASITSTTLIHSTSSSPPFVPANIMGSQTEVQLSGASLFSHSEGVEPAYTRGTARQSPGKAMPRPNPSPGQSAGDTRQSSGEAMPSPNPSPGQSAGDTRQSSGEAMPSPNPSPGQSAGDTRQSSGEAMPSPNPSPGQSAGDTRTKNVIKGTLSKDSQPPRITLSLGPSASDVIVNGVTSNIEEGAPFTLLSHPNGPISGPLATVIRQTLSGSSDVLSVPNRATIAGLARPPLIVDGRTFTAHSASFYVIDGQTLRPGLPAIVITGSAVIDPAHLKEALTATPRTTDEALTATAGSTVPATGGPGLSIDKPPVSTAEMSASSDRSSTLVLDNKSVTLASHGQNTAVKTFATSTGKASSIDRIGWRQWSITVGMVVLAHFA